MIKLPSDEKIVIFTRRHPITLFFKMISFLVVLLILITAIVYFYYKFVNFLNAPSLLMAFVVFLILTFFLAAFIYFTNWYLDVWIVTDKRVIDIEQISLFNSEFSEFMLDKVQDVTIDKIGFLASIFNYGDVHIQTAGMSRVFIFKQVPNPQKIKDYLLKRENSVSVEKSKSI